MIYSAKLGESFDSPKFFCSKISDIPEFFAVNISDIPKIYPTRLVKTSMSQPLMAM